ncbi:MAG: hypothetical protein IJV41_11025 [Oscillospiraceae bacterium]|nr:hypothetical protein [Oscillospiraceae bacterium]
MARGRYAALLLGLYLLGVMLALVNPAFIASRFPALDQQIIPAAALLLTVDGVLNSSVCAAPLLPVCSLLFGVLSALEAQRILEKLTVPEAGGWLHAAAFSAVVVVHFVLCGFGMDNAFRLRSVLRRNGQLNRDFLIPTYTCMLTGISAGLLLIRFIMRL